MIVRAHDSNHLESTVFFYFQTKRLNIHASMTTKIVNVLNMARENVATAAIVRYLYRLV